MRPRPAGSSHRNWLWPPWSAGLAGALGLFACGGAGGQRPQESPAFVRAPDPGSGPVACDADAGLALGPIEDFELGAAGSGWYANNDVCAPCQALVDRRAELEAILAADPGNVDVERERDEVRGALRACRGACLASQSPTIFDKPLFATPIQDGGRCDSRYALHLQTQPLQGWGGNLGLTFDPPLDAREWAGIAFWGRVGPGSRNAVRVELGDRNTDEKVLGPDGAPICNPNPTPDTYETGCDKFGQHLLLNGDWQLFLVPWTELRQAGWGRRVEALDLAAIRTLSFTFGPGAWDLWVDDVALVAQ